MAAEHKSLMNKHTTEPVSTYKPMMTSSGLVSLYTPKAFSNIDELFTAIKSTYLVPELKSVQIKGTSQKKFSVKSTENITFNKISNDVAVENLRQSIEKSLKSTYKNLLTKNLVSEAEHKQIEQMIDMELKRLNKDNINNISEIKNTIKVHVARMLISKHLEESNVFEPLNNVSAILEEIYGNNDGKIVEFENLFNNIINYETDEPFIVLKKSMNNMIDFLVSLKDISVSNVANKTQDLLYKKLATVSMLKPIKKNLKKVFMREVVYDDLNVMNLLLMISYTESGNSFTTEMIEKFAEKIELLQNKITNKVWTWASKSNSKKIISELVNMEDTEFMKLIVNEMITNEESIELSNAMLEMTALVKTLDVSGLKSMKSEFNNLYDMFFKMYQMDVVPHNLNKMNSKKSFEDLKREYFLGLMTGLYTKTLEKLLNKSDNKRMRNYIIKNLSVLGMYLNEKSAYLSAPVAKKPTTVVVEAVEDKDELLNDFMLEDLDLDEITLEEDIVADVEDVNNMEDFEFEDQNEEDLMEELFGEDY